jgi:hypothetical protein
MIPKTTIIARCGACKSAFRAEFMEGRTPPPCPLCDNRFTTYRVSEDG